MMLFRDLKRSSIKKILVVSLSNIGDVVLTCPVVDALIDSFPLAEISLIVGPKAVTLFDQSPYIKKVYPFTKKESWGELLSLFGALKGEGFDAVIDLRNTALAYLLGAPFHTSGFFRQDPSRHKKDQHFSRLMSVFPDMILSQNRYAVFVNELVRKKAEMLLQPTMGTSKTYFVFSAGAADVRKRWTVEGFVAVARALLKDHPIPIFFIGDDKDEEYTQRIVEQLPPAAVNLAGKASLLESTWILRNSHLVFCNDSAVMHLASYFDVPVLGLFGPTDPMRYGPWGQRGAFLKTDRFDANRLGLIEGIKVSDVLEKINEILYRGTAKF